MGVGGVLQRLGGFVDECEAAQPVESVDLAGGIDSSGDQGVRADVELTLSARPPDEEFELCATSVNADGTVRFGFETVDGIVPRADDVEVEPAGATVGPDGRVRLTLSVSVLAPDGHEPVTSDSSRAKSDGDSEPAGGSEPGPAPSSTSDRDLPPFKDPELLGEIYESCDTFAEMAETLDMDVTAETVRRYMIDFDIHEPNSYDTGTSDGDRSPESDDVEQTPPVLSDGIGLPEDITVETLIDTVERSNTIYEVKQDLGVDREDALEVLRECNLLDLVMCRLATEAERDITRRDVIERLRAASTAA